MKTSLEHTSLPRWLKYCLVASATVLAIVGIYGGVSIGVKADWLAFYTAGYALIHGLMPNLYDLAAIHSWQSHLIGDHFVAFLYAPAYSLLFIPVAVLPVSAARILWLVTSLLTGIFAARLSMHWTHLSFGNSILGLMAFAPFAYALAVGQISSVTLLLFSLVIALEWRGKHGWLSGFLAGMALYKPQLFIPIMLFWIVKRRWRELAGFFTAASIIVTLSLLISPSATKEYLLLPTRLMDLADNATETGANVALFALSPHFGALVGSIVTLLLFVALRHPLNRYSIAMIWIAPLFTTPYMGIYDLLLLALPISLIIPVVSQDRMLQFALFLLWFTPIIAIIVLNIYPMTFSALYLFVICFSRSLSHSSSINVETKLMSIFSDTSN